jgi:glycosyltransferase involved in cell wall biosynthesis
VRHAGWGFGVKPRIKVLRIADWSPGFSTLPQSILDLEKRLIEEVDLVVVSAEALEERLRPVRGDRPMIVLRNGVDSAFWQEPQPLPVEYHSIPEPRVIYTGAIDEWFDFELLNRIAHAMSDTSFVVVGQRRVDIPVDTPPNIYWTGTRSRDQIRGYLQHAQVGMIPFKRNDLIDCVCPLKLYEYAVCGLPVVATCWEELERMDSPAGLVTTLDEWIDALNWKIEESSSSLMHAKLRSYGNSHDWENRWESWQRIYQSLVSGSLLPMASN